MTLEAKLTEIQTFFNIQVDGYILADLENLMAIKGDGRGFGMCTIPAAMLIISSMEMFGTLLTASPNETGSPIYLKNFIEEYIPEISERDRDCLIYNYRHKMMHLFFPKVNHPKMYGITKTPANNDLINRENSDRPILNVIKLAQYFKKSVEVLRQRLLTTKDETLINIFYDNIEFPTENTTTTTTTQTTNPRG
jgi:hypothetical protein